MSLLRFLPALLVLGAISSSASAAEFNGAELSLLWAVPFAGILLSIALCPLFAAHFWHEHFGKVSLAWALCTAVPLFAFFGSSVATAQIAHAIVGDYIPFLLFVGALFVVAGGIHLRGRLVGTPVINTGILLIGAFLANLMGTTGAAMLLIRPLIDANSGRKRTVHTFIFFIFIVANIGGCLTPLGDPPLFLGFLRGVHFFWTTAHLILPLALVLAILLVLYFIIDSICYRKDIADGSFVVPADTSVSIKVDGAINILWLAVIVGTVLMSGFWNSGVEFEFLTVHLTLQGIVRDAIFVVVTVLSVLTTPKAARTGNQFTWDPILEIAKLFFGIFVCIVPVLAMLRAGHDGHFAPIVNLVTDADGNFNNIMFFWMTGALSAFLDNAPTYLAFFNLAGGNPAELMTTHASTLMAVSMGAVFMGAMTYIGNAPNFMTLSIVTSRGIKMPSFLGYMVWSIVFLVPTFLIADFIFLH